jgi:hypothetical protein
MRKTTWHCACPLSLRGNVTERIVAATAPGPAPMLFNFHVYAYTPERPPELKHCTRFIRCTLSNWSDARTDCLCYNDSGSVMRSGFEHGQTNPPIEPLDLRNLEGEPGPNGPVSAQVYDGAQCRWYPFQWQPVWFPLRRDRSSDDSHLFRIVEEDSFRVISSDGNTMTRTNAVIETGVRSTDRWTRVGAATDSDLIVGTWSFVPGSLEPDTPERLIIAQQGDSITVSEGIPGRATPEFTAKVDGKNYPWIQGKGFGVATVSLRQLDDHSFAEFRKVGGQPYITAKYVLSQDGKTLTKTFTLVAKTPKTMVSIFGKQ